MSSKLTVALALFASCVLTPTLRAQLSHPFFPEPVFGTGAEPVRVAAGDLDGDGRPDVVVGRVGASSGSIQILYNMNGATFSAPSADYFTFSSPTAIAIGDVDGDGDLDIVVTCSQGNVISVFKNLGGGTFSQASFITTGAGANGLALGDVDQDGDLDLVVAFASPGNGSVAVFTNDGTGSFVLTASYPAGANPLSVAIGDLDGDGDLDIAATSTSGNLVTVFVNLGNGLFTIGGFYPGNGAASVAIADLDGDGDLDLALALGSNGIRILLNNGHASFSARGSLSLQALSVAAVDMDSDGDLDLLVHGGSGLIVLTNDGSASFAPPVEYLVGRTPYGIATGDFDGDGHVDVVGVDFFADAIQVARNDGTGKLETPDVYYVPYIPSAAAIADLDGDGDLDLALIGHTPNTFGLRVAKNDGQGGFAPFGGVLFGPNPSALAAGDVDGDGDVDLVASVMSATSGGLLVLLNDGSGTFGVGPFYSVDPSPHSLVLADFDGDGDLDMAVANDVSAGTIRIFANNGDGTFSPSAVLNAGNSPRSLGVADFDGDGDLDLVVLNTAASNFYVYANNGDGTFAAPVPFRLPDNPVQLALGDLNADGYPDLAISLSSPVQGMERVVILTNVGHGHSFNPFYFSTGSSNGEVAICDWNGDGRLDVVAGSWAGAWLLANNGDGTFTANGRYFTLGLSTFLGSGDLNGDGRPDLVHTGLSATVEVGVSFNNGPLSPFFKYCYGDGGFESPCPCGNNGVPGHGCENSASTGGARLAANGTTGPDTVVLTSAGELPSVLSIALPGDQTRTPLFYGDGLRCVIGHLLRLYTKNASSGIVTMPQSGDPAISARSAALGDPIAPGSMRYYQVYYRDSVLGFCPTPGNSWNVSNAVAIQW